MALNCFYFHKECNGCMDCADDSAFQDDLYECKALIDDCF